MVIVERSGGRIRRRKVVLLVDIMMTKQVDRTVPFMGVGLVKRESLHSERSGRGRSDYRMSANQRAVLCEVAHPHRLMEPWVHPPVRSSPFQS